MNQVNLYTDGSCIPNPGKGGWGWVLISNDMEIEENGGKMKTTNNEMEMMAVLEGLSFLENESTKLTINIYSDSQYVINCATGKWKRNKNLELWEKLDKLIKKFKINWNWVRGHTGDKYNEIADRLANKGRESI